MGNKYGNTCGKYLVEGDLYGCGHSGTNIGRFGRTRPIFSNQLEGTCVVSVQPISSAGYSRCRTVIGRIQISFFLGRCMIHVRDIKMDCEKLISLVQERRSLWDPRCGQYHNRDVARKLWIEIATSLETTSKY